MKAQKTSKQLERRAWAYAIIGIITIIISLIALHKSYLATPQDRTTLLVIIVFTPYVIGSIFSILILLTISDRRRRKAYEEKEKEFNDQPLRHIIPFPLIPFADSTMGRLPRWANDENEAFKKSYETAIEDLERRRQNILAILDRKRPDQILLKEESRAYAKAIKSLKKAAWRQQNLPERIVRTKEKAINAFNKDLDRLASHTLTFARFSKDGVKGLESLLKRCHTLSTELEPVKPRLSERDPDLPKEFLEDHKERIAPELKRFKNHARTLRKAQWLKEEGSELLAQRHAKALQRMESMKKSYLESVPPRHDDLEEIENAFMNYLFIRNREDLEKIKGFDYAEYSKYEWLVKIADHLENGIDFFEDACDNVDYGLLTNYRMLNDYEKNIRPPRDQAEETAKNPKT